jgi:hypothetical protein
VRRSLSHADAGGTRNRCSIAFVPMVILGLAVWDLAVAPAVVIAIEFVWWRRNRYGR